MGAIRLLELWRRVWPKTNEEGADSLEEDARAFLHDASGEDGRRERFHLIWDGDVLMAAAKSFLREIEFYETGERMDVLALAGVCSSPVARGRGFGKQVVRSAFERVGRDAALSLYQTGVPMFYEKLGAKAVQNEFVNSLSGEAPQASPWWNEHVMIYGDTRKWREGRVDLLGAGY